MAQLNPIPVRVSDRRFLESNTVELDSDAPKSVDVYGRYFIVRSAETEFEMRLNSGQWFKMNQGEGFDLGDEDRFTKLSFRRLAGETGTVNVSFRTADCAMFDARLNIVRDPNHQLVITAENTPVPTYSLNFASLKTGGDQGAASDGYTFLLATAKQSQIFLPGLINDTNVNITFQVLLGNGAVTTIDWATRASGVITRTRLKILTTAECFLIPRRNWDGIANIDASAVFALANQEIAWRIAAGVSFITDDSQDYILATLAASALCSIIADYDWPLTYNLTVT
jgi:hypothetical protein